jgi:Uma2 family endonuclease
MGASSAGLRHRALYELDEHAEEARHEKVPRGVRRAVDRSFTTWANRASLCFMVALESTGLFYPRRMSDDEWVNMDDEEEGELVDGMLVEEEETGWLHESAAAWFIGNLAGWALPRRGLVGGSRLKYLLRPGHGRKPDVSMILPGQRLPPRHGAMRRPADVLIEVISPSPRDVRRDRIEKFGEYAAFGSRYYWLLDPTMRTFEIYELNASKRYELALGAQAGTLDAIPGCDGLVLDLDELWAELDRLSDEEEETPENENPAQ